MILNDSKIEALANSKHLIYPFNKSCVQPASYDVTLDFNLVLVKADSKNAVFDPMYRSSLGVNYKTITIPEEGYILKPGEFVLGSTVEEVELPSNISARFDGKSSLGRMGLVTHVTAGFIDPGFRGQITLEIKNNNSEDIGIILRRGMHIGQIVFSFMTNPAVRPYGSYGLGSHYQYQVGPTLSVE